MAKNFLRHSRLWQIVDLMYHNDDESQCGDYSLSELPPSPFILYDAGSLLQLQETLALSFGLLVHLVSRLNAGGTEKNTAN